MTSQELLGHHRLRPGSLVECVLSCGAGSSYALEGQIHPLSLESGLLHLQLEGGFVWAVEASRVLELRELGVASPPVTPNKRRWREAWEALALVRCGDAMSWLPDIEAGAVEDLQSCGAKGGVFWKQLAGRLDALCRLEQIRGVVVVHPVESLLHTLRVVAWMLGPLPCPIVGVGIPRPQSPVESWSDALLQAAFWGAQKADIGEVMLCAPGDQGFELWRPLEVLRLHPTAWRGFGHPQKLPLARISGDGEPKLLRRDIEPALPRRSSLRAGFEARVQLFAGLPGLPLAPPQEGLKGAILALWDQGFGDEQWEALAAWLQQEQIPTFAASQALSGDVQLQATALGRRLKALGVRGLKGLHAEAACLKLGWVLAHWTGDEIYAQMDACTPGQSDR